MLSAFLSSWLQDLSGAAATLKTLQSVNSTLLPLLLVAPIVIVAFLLAARNEASRGPGNTSRETPNRTLDRRPPQPAGSGPSSNFDQAARSQPPMRAEPPLVLVADDSPVVRGKLSRLLSGAGFSVVDACDGQQALALLHSSRVPSVLITDLEMPTVDGFELIAAVQGGLEIEHLPIIAITGHDDLQARVADLSGIYGIFSKPWNDRALLRRVRALASLTEADAGHG